MPEAAPSDGHEGWRVHGWGGVGLVTALYALAVLGMAVTGVLFAIYSKPIAPPLPTPFPEPRLNGRIDRDPHWSYAPKITVRPHIDDAMIALSHSGDAAWQGGAATPSNKAGGRP